MTTPTIQELCKEANATAEAHGFFHDEESIPEKLMLVVTECAEAMEDWRKYQMDHFPEELADIVIRVFALAGGLHIDLGTAIDEKMRKNKTRPFRHNGKRG